MATQVQLRRGSTNQTSTFIGAVGELTIDTDKKAFTKLPSELLDNKYITAIKGNGNDKDTISSLRINKSEIVIVCTGKDTLNCLIAQKISILSDIDKEKIIILVKDFYIGNFYRSLDLSMF